MSHPPTTYRLSPTQAAGLVEITWCTGGKHATPEYRNATRVERCAIQERFASGFTAASMRKMVALGLFRNERGCWIPTAEGVRVAHAIRNDWACVDDMPRVIKMVIPDDYRPNEWATPDLGTMGCRIRPSAAKEWGDLRTWCGKVPPAPRGLPADGEHCDECEGALAFVVADIVAIVETR